MNDITAPNSIEQPFDAILRSLMTTSDAERLHDQINKFLTEIYQEDRKDLKGKIDEIFDEVTSKTIHKMIVEQKIDKSNHEQIRKLVTLLQESLSRCSTLSLSLSQYPNEKLIALLSDFAKEHFGIQVVLEINVNPSLIGGAIIVFEGKYIDQSLKKKLEILFEAKRDEISNYIK